MNIVPRLRLGDFSPALALLLSACLGCSGSDEESASGSATSTGTGTSETSTSTGQTSTGETSTGQTSTGETSTGETSSGTDTDANSGIYDDYIKAKAEAICEYSVGCGIAFSLETCVHGWVLIEQSLRTGLSESIDHGSVIFDPEQAEECLDFIRNGACTHAFFANYDDDLTCTSVFSGDRENGAPCTVQQHCSSGVCEWEMCESQCCEGVCVPSAAIGESCASTACASGATCYDNGVENLCIEIASLGEGALCSWYDECSGELVCVGEACTVPPSKGEPCLDSVLCSFTSSCDPETNICVANKGVGESCDPELGLYESLCAGDLHCDYDTLVCTAPAPAGSLCKYFWGCDESSYCDNGLCALLVELGEPCENESCASGYCDEATWTCVEVGTCLI